MANSFTGNVIIHGKKQDRLDLLNTIKESTKRAVPDETVEHSDDFFEGKTKFQMSFNWDFRLLTSKKFLEFCRERKTTINAYGIDLGLAVIHYLGIDADGEIVQEEGMEVAYTHVQPYREPINIIASNKSISVAVERKTDKMILVDHFHKDRNEVTVVKELSKNEFANKSDLELEDLVEERFDYMVKTNDRNKLMYLKVKDLD